MQAALSFLGSLLFPPALPFLCLMLNAHPTPSPLRSLKITHKSIKTRPAHTASQHSSPGLFPPLYFQPLCPCLFQRAAHFKRVLFLCVYSGLWSLRYFSTAWLFIKLLPEMNPLSFFLTQCSTWVLCIDWPRTSQQYKDTNKMQKSLDFDNQPEGFSLKRELISPFLGTRSSSSKSGKAGIPKHVPIRPILKGYSRLCVYTHTHT